MLATSRNFTKMVWRAVIHLLKRRSMGAKPNLHCAILPFIFDCGVARCKSPQGSCSARCRNWNFQAESCYVNQAEKYGGFHRWQSPRTNCISCFLPINVPFKPSKFTRLPRSSISSHWNYNVDGTEHIQVTHGRFNMKKHCAAEKKREQNLLQRSVSKLKTASLNAPC